MSVRAGGRGIALMLESDGPGGAETLVLQLAESLRARGYAVTPVGPERGCGWLGAVLRERGFHPATFRLAHPLDWRCATGLASLFRERGIEIVHSHEFTMAVYGTAACLLTGARHVITMHGGRHVLQSMLRVWRRRLALRWAIRHSARTVAVSSVARDYLCSTLGLSPCMLGCVSNGIGFVEGQRRQLRDELALDEDDPLIVATGNLYPVKGHAVLLRAFAQIRDGSRLPHLAIAGRGDQEPILRALAAELGVSERLHLLGQRSDVPDLLAAADLFVLPSLSEGMPVALIEAMSAGLPVVASAVGGIPEMVEQGRDAVLVPPGDPQRLAFELSALLRNHARRRVLGEAARRTATARFTIARMTDAYESMYLGQAEAVEACNAARRDALSLAMKTTAQGGPACS